ncbi:MAG: cytochrome C [Alphaproteobacteria bacterium TMED194]|nr:MAG: cytochrome C [Alphaproteobacteria bacterium TMED194]|tara:strand:+ start:1836 stop:2144 length:309 start_codon:yes stop_codon:yes gene_type:complete
MNKFIIALTLVLSTNAVAEDRFASIRQTMNTCAACHGPQGQGGLGPKLQGQTADEIISKLLAYKNKEVVGPQSAMMWPTAGMLTEGEIGMIGVYITQGYPDE